MPIEHDDIPAGPNLPVVWATTVEGPPENVERALGLIRGQILAVYKGQPGWQGTLGLVSYDRRRCLLLNFWESEVALQEHVADAVRLREHAGALGVAIRSNDRFEIQFDERLE
jgi:hypothetical protein